MHQLLTMCSVQNIYSSHFGIKINFQLFLFRAFTFQIQSRLFQAISLSNSNKHGFTSVSLSYGYSCYATCIEITFKGNDAGQQISQTENNSGFETRLAKAD